VLAAGTADDILPWLAAHVPHLEALTLLPNSDHLAGESHRAAEARAAYRKLLATLRFVDVYGCYLDMAAAAVAVRGGAGSEEETASGGSRLYDSWPNKVTDLVERKSGWYAELLTPAAPVATLYTNLRRLVLSVAGSCEDAGGAGVAAHRFFDAMNLATSSALRVLEVDGFCGVNDKWVARFFYSCNSNPPSMSPAADTQTYRADDVAPALWRLRELNLRNCGVRFDPNSFSCLVGLHEGSRNSRAHGPRLQRLTVSWERLHPEAASTASALFPRLRRLHLSDSA
jgi:hypothetical protein